MYVSRHHQLSDRETLYALMQAHPLGAWVCQAQGVLVANHVPFLLDRGRGEFGTLVGHVSRANSVWRGLGTDTPSMVMFQGPQSYISPGWYPSKALRGEVVPTWDYVVAHVHGVARIFEDRDGLLDMLNRLTDAHEARRPAPWRVADAPAAYIDGLLRGIVGIEIPIARVEGKLKASQDEAWQDRQGTAKGLEESGRDEARALAGWVRGAMDADPSGPG